MLLDICLGTRSAWKIILLMSESPGKAMSKREIQAQTKIGGKVLVKFMDLLKKFGVIQETSIGKRSLYRMNMANSFTISIIEIVRLERQQLNSPYFGTAMVLREFVYELTNINPGNLQRVILFGSVAKHTARVDSDIDIAIIVKENNPKDELMISKACGDIESRFGRIIQPHLFTEKEFSLKKTKLVNEVVRDGVELV